VLIKKFPPSISFDLHFDLPVRFCISFFISNIVLVSIILFSYLFHFVSHQLISFMLFCLFIRITFVFSFLFSPVFYYVLRQFLFSRRLVFCPLTKPVPNNIQLFIVSEMLSCLQRTLFQYWNVKGSCMWYTLSE